MKKSLLLASIGLMGAASMFAQNPQVDPTVYNKMEVHGRNYEFRNLWIYAQNLDNFGALPFFGGANGSRTAAIYKDQILITNNIQGALYKYDLTTGHILGVVNYFIEGYDKAIGMDMTNQIGVDDFDNVYLIGYVADLRNTAIVIRTVNVETGELTEVGTINARDDEFTGEKPRTDYYQIIGDVTGKEAKGQFVCATANSGLEVLRAERAQGSDEWVGLFDNESYSWGEIRDMETSPAGQTSWGTAPFSCLIKDEEFSGDLFYVDGFTTRPALYDMEGQISGDFGQLGEDSGVQLPVVGTNGIGEFSLGGYNFAVYSQNDRGTSAGDNPDCAAQIACFGASTDYADLKGMWVFPGCGFGKTSDVGTRIHCLATRVNTDANGKQAALVLTYKVCNGIAVYEIAEEGYAGIHGVEVDETNNAPAVYYNLQGMEVANPSNGIFIVKQGNKVSKQVIR